MRTPSDLTSNRRIGFHYFPDTAHYRQIDLEAWLPELQRLGAAGITLIAPATRAIPENFITAMLASGIEPTLHFPFHCRPGEGAPHEAINPALAWGIQAVEARPALDTLRLLLNAYARWGVKRVAFFDRPNLCCMWQPSDWLQGDLVEQFLDLFLPAAERAVDAGISPVFPPLAPGGDYWDMSFLRSALRGLKRRNATKVLDRLILSAEAFSGERPLDWGNGGPERWPSARPYFTPAGEQDHLGFRIFEWYLSVSRQELGFALPLILMRAGQRRTGVAAGAVDEPAGAGTEASSTQAQDDSLPGEAHAPAGPQFAADIAHARQNLAIAELLAAAPEAGGLPAEVLAGHFWLLSAAPRTPAAAESWFPPAGRLLPVVGAFQSWAARQWKLEPPTTPAAPVEAEGDEQPGEPTATLNAIPPTADETSILENEPPLCPEPVESHLGQLGGEDDPAMIAKGFRTGPIDHYILLPLYAWGAADWDLALIQPLVHDGHPTIGFSLTEARLARRVTVVGGSGAVSTEALAMLRKAGCQVERLMEDGTVVASR